MQYKQQLSYELRKFIILQIKENIQKKKYNKG